jgi:hypothetical protein
MGGFTTIQLRRGLFADLPASAALGELLWCTDTGQIFMGNGPDLAPTLTKGSLFSNTDVALTTPADNDVLTFDGTSSLWKNKPAGGTPGGADGDVQFNNGAGGFTNANGVHAGSILGFVPGSFSEVDFNLTNNTTPNGGIFIEAPNGTIEIVALNTLALQAGDVSIFASGSGAHGKLKLNGTLLAFFDVNIPIAKPVVAGSRGGNAALASLLTALAALGLISDTTTV